MSKRKAPGKTHRKGITLVELMAMFPTEEAANQWFEAVLWDGHRCCGKCGSERTSKVPNAKPMPYWCSDCRGYFSVRTGTPIARSKIPLRKWAVAIYLCLTSLKSISSMKLHRDIGVSQPAAWFMLHRIREAWATNSDGGGYAGPVEVDKTYMGGKRRNMSSAKRKTLEGRGTSGKTAVLGAKDRASNQVSAAVVGSTDKETLQSFVVSKAAPDATVYTDDAKAYQGLEHHDSVKHSVGEYVRGQTHTNGIESFWAIAETRLQGHLPQVIPEAPRPVRSGIRGQAQHARFRHHHADARQRRPYGRSQPPLSRPHRRQRAIERGARVK